MNRRARIKGIANIPVRRKTEITACNESGKSESVISSEKQDIEEKCEANKNIDIASDISISNAIQNDNKTETSPENHESSQNINLSNTSNSEIENNKEFQNVSSEHNDLVANTNPTISRRWIPKPKPIVKNPSMLRRPKPVLVPLKDKTETVINQNIENEKPTDVTPSVEEIKCLSSVQSSTQNIETSTSIVNNSIIKPAEPEKILTSPLSPNKLVNRARIRPMPKLIRRNSIQGSASESEDDGRRSRIRNDSVCSTTSYSTEITVKENTTVSKEKIISIKVHKLFRRSEQSRKVAEAKKDFYHKFGSSIPDRKRLTMMDLIYYNPITNPMPQRKQNTIIEEITQEEIENEEEENEDEPEEVEEDITPVPQVKVGPNGEIILDEQSLVIEQTGAKKGREKLANSQVVNADDLDRNYGIYKRPKRSKDWSAIETLRFYRSLNTVGTDFSLMVSLFPGRTRRELKMKFKKEEKINRQLIDKALTNPLDFDLSELEKQLQDEEEFIKKMELEQKQKKSKPKKRLNSSVLAAEMDEENDDEPLIKRISRVIRPKRIQKPPKDRYSALNIAEITTSESEPEYEVPSKKNKQEKVNLCKRDSHKENCDDLPNILFSQDELSSKKDLLVPEKDKQSCDDVPDILNQENVLQETELLITQNEKQNNIENITQEFDSNRKNEHIEDINENMDVTEENDDETMKCEIENKNTDTPVLNDKNCVIPNILPNDLSTVEPGSLMILSTVGPDNQQVFKVFMVTQGQSKVPVNLSEDIVQSLATSLGSAEAVTLDLPVINESEMGSPDKV